MQQVFNTDPTEPHVPEELLRFLQTKFPLAGFRNVRSEKQLDRYQGAIDVVEILEVMFQRQTNQG